MSAAKPVDPAKLTKDDTNVRTGLRSRGSANPKEAGQQAVALHTAAAGPDGGPLRGKYRRASSKATRSKTSGNSGNAGRRYRRKVRQGGYTTSSYTNAGRHSKP